MIEEIVISGFKSLRGASIQIKPITILIGLNSSGKSSVIQCLEVLKQTAQRESSRLEAIGDLINLGGFMDIVFQKKERNEINIKIRGYREQFLESPFGNETEYDYSFAVDSRGLKHHSCSITSGKFRLRGEYNRGKKIANIEVPFLNAMLLFKAVPIIGKPFSYQAARGEVQDINYDDLQAQFLNVIRKDLNDFFIVPAIRGISSPSYPLDRQAFDDILDQNNLYNQAVKLSSTVVYKSPELERQINKWISRITGITIRARTVPDKHAAIEASRSIDVNIVNEGFGSNQLVHLFAQIATAPDNSLIGVEEPEVHLHPRAQSELSKVLIEISRQESKNFLITTHSEHILYRVIIEIAKGKLNPEEVGIYHFALSKDGTTKVERLKMDKGGRLEKGIPDFFETDLDEFKDLLEALKT